MVSRFRLDGEAMQVQWRQGFVVKTLLDRINAALEAADLDDEERVGLVDRIEQSMLTNGGVLRTIDDLTPSTRKILGLK